MYAKLKKLLIFGTILSAIIGIQLTDCGIIKDIYQKVTNTNNKTEDVVKQSAPICGSGVFSSTNEAAISPEIIFITNRASKIVPTSSGSSGYNNNNNQYERESSSNGRENERRRQVNNNNNNNNNSNGNYNHNGGNQDGGRVSEVANEYSFHFENVTMRDLEQRGFNRQAPVTFLIHGFTSGYPLQAWISAIVEAYTIDRESSHTGSQREQDSNYNQFDSATSGQSHQQYNQRENSSYQERRRGSSSSSSLNNSNSRENTPQNGRASQGSRLNHNLFIINWNYAARGPILYPRAVANIPIVASYVTRFINEKLLGEAKMDPSRIQLIGHSLGAHLAGFVGKNTKQKVGKIYGLDPAGPCFGTLSGPLYPASKRLAQNDAQEVITVHTNSDLLGIDKPLGRYSIFVEGGAKQPGCKGGGVLKSLQALTWDGEDFDTLACSHSRAPNLFTYRHDQSSREDDCQMVAYACKDWESFLAGHCGVCDENRESESASQKRDNPLQSVACKRIGLDWQYYDKRQTVSGNNYNSQSSYSNNNNNGYQSNSNNNNYNNQDGSGNNNNYYDNNNNNREQEQYENVPSSTTSNNYNRRPMNQNERNKRQTNNSNNQQQQDNNNERDNTNAQDNKEERERGNENDNVKPISMFLRTGDTQPYCTFHYQIILELNEPFPSRGKPPMSIILQDSEQTGEERRPQRDKRQTRSEQNSISDDAFGNKFNDKTYTHLLTSHKKLKKIDHATLIFRNGLENGHKLFRSLQINYMSHPEQQVRRRLLSRLCPVKTEIDRSRNNQTNRFYFKPCGAIGSNESSSSSGNSENSSNGNNLHANNGFGNNHSSNNNNNNYNNGNNRENNHQNSSNGYHRNNNNFNNNGRNYRNQTYGISGTTSQNNSGNSDRD